MGKISKRSPTIPKSETLNIFASGSLFIAIIILEEDIPARCYTAPEIPIAIYN